MMRPTFLLAMLVAATFPSTDDLRSRVSTGGDLRPEAKPVSIEGRSIQVGLCTIHMDEGSALPIKAGKGENEWTAGFIFQGEGTLEFPFERRADAWNFANHMALTARQDVDALAPIAHQEVPYRTTIGRGVVISTRDDVLSVLLPEDVERVEGMDLASTADMTIIVEDRRDKLVRAIAAGATVPTRVLLMLKGGLDLRPRISDEMLQRSWGGLPQDRRLAFADFITDDHFAVARPGVGKDISGPEDRWLSCLDDPTGILATGERSTVFAHGQDSDGTYHRRRFTGQGHPMETRLAPDVPGLPRGDFEAVKATVNVDAEPIRMRKFVEYQVDSEITLRATRDGVRQLTLSLPRFEAKGKTFQIDHLGLKGGDALPWAPLGVELMREASRGNLDSVAPVEGETVDGGTGPSTAAGPGATSAGASTAAETQEQAMGTMQFPQETADLAQMSPDRSWMRADFLVLLPEPLNAGDEITLDLDWHGEWNFVNGYSSGDYVTSGGPTTGFRNLLPQLHPIEAGTRWDHTTTVTIPSLNGFELAVSGATQRTWYDQETDRITIMSRGKDQLRPGMALGKWVSFEEPSIVGWPAILVHLHPVESYALEEFGPQLRAVLKFYDALMPKLAENEFEIYQGSDLVGPRPSEPGDTMLELNQIGTGVVGSMSGTYANKLDPFSGHTLLAREVGRRYWNGMVLPGGQRDAWIRDIMPEVYASFYIRGVQGTQEYFEWMETVRGAVEQQFAEDLGVKTNLLTWGLTDTSTDTAAFITPRHWYGTYIIGNSLRYMVGEDLYYPTLDAFLQEAQGGYVTTDMLQEQFEAASGRDLSDFFDFWIHGGRVPGITVETNTVDGTTRGCIASDVPFGRVEIPITLVDKDGRRTVSALVPVADGAGQFEVGQRIGDVEVLVDPDGLLPLRKRKVNETKTLDCF